MQAPLAPARPMHELSAPSDWITRWTPAITTACGSAPQVLDLACGQGRHVRWWAAQGAAVVAVDRNQAALDALGDLAAERIEADLEGGPWPLAERSFDVVVVTNYLWRPLLPRIVSAVKPGGWLLYETFARGQERIGRPSNPDFLLAPGELLDALRGSLRVVAFEEGLLARPERCVQRIAAVRCTAADSGPYPLSETPAP